MIRREIKGAVVKVERSRDWVDQAEGGLEHAKSDRERGYFDWACFSAQQPAVKAVFQKWELRSGDTLWLTCQPS